jgi:F5/8 type C domain
MASTTTLSAGVGTTITVPYYNIPYTYLRFNVVVFTGTDVGINQLSFYPRNLDLNNATINNVIDPTTAQQVATKNYTDTTFIKKDGTVAMTGNLNMWAHTINNVTDPTTAQQAATKNYVDNGRAYLQVAPTNMTSNTAPAPYVASTNNPNGLAQYGPYAAFDSNGATWFSTNVGGATGGYLSIYLGAQYIVTKLYITTAQDGTGYATNWTVSGSNDGTTSKHIHLTV